MQFPFFHHASLLVPKVACKNCAAWSSLSKRDMSVTVSSPDKNVDADSFDVRIDAKCHEKAGGTLVIEVSLQGARVGELHAGEGVLLRRERLDAAPNEPDVSSTFSVRPFENPQAAMDFMMSLVQPEATVARRIKIDVLAPDMTSGDSFWKPIFSSTHDLNVGFVDSTSTRHFQRACKATSDNNEKMSLLTSLMRDRRTSTDISSAPASEARFFGSIAPSDRLKKEREAFIAARKGS